MSRCLVLGANGFVGSHLVDALVAQGHNVRAFGRFNGKQNFNSNEKIEIFYGDFLNKDDLATALKDVEYVFHFISTTTPATSENDPLIDIETNVRMSIELFGLCAQAGVKRVLFASTGGAIYGEGSESPVSEMVSPLPVSPYAIGKLTIEHYLRYFRIKHGLDSLTFRISNPYGERQPLHRKQGVIPIFLENIVSKRPLTVLGDGTMVRDYVYVGDVVSMIASMFDKQAKDNVYNIGSGRGVSVNELVSAIETVSEVTAQVENKAVPATFVHKVVLDINLFKDEFGLEPQTSLLDGLNKTFEYVKDEVAANYDRQN